MVEYSLAKLCKYIIPLRAKHKDLENQDVAICMCKEIKNPSPYTKGYMNNMCIGMEIIEDRGKYHAYVNNSKVEECEKNLKN